MAASTPCRPGFGWIDGVVLIVASTSKYDDILVAAQCPDVMSQVTLPGNTATTSNSALSSWGFPSIFVVAADAMAIMMAFYLL